MIDQEEIRKKITEEIKNCGISQTKIAKAIGIKQQTISEYINGKSMPSIETFANLCLFLDLDANEILCLKQNNGKIFNDIHHNNQVTINQK